MLDRVNDFIDLCRIVALRARNPTSKNVLRAIRTNAKKHHFAVAPMGTGNRKTKLPGTYRPVGISCPIECIMHPLRNGASAVKCYARRGFVGFAQKRSVSATTEMFLNAVVATIISRYAEISHFGSGLVGKRGARLHVSGDFSINNTGIDEEYIAGVLAVGKRLQRLLTPKEELAYVYTHIPSSRFEPYREKLQEVGVTTVYSIDEGLPDRSKPASIVWPFNNFKKLKEVNNSGLNLVKCPSQLSEKIKCNTCTFCGKENTCVVFDPLEGTFKSGTNE